MELEDVILATDYNYIWIEFPNILHQQNTKESFSFIYDFMNVLELIEIEHRHAIILSLRGRHREMK